MKTNLYKQRTRLENIKASDLFPNYAAAAARFNDRLFINEKSIDNIQKRAGGLC